MALWNRKAVACRAWGMLSLGSLGDKEVAQLGSDGWLSLTSVEVWYEFSPTEWTPASQPASCCSSRSHCWWPAESSHKAAQGESHERSNRFHYGLWRSCTERCNSLTIGADGPILLHDVHFLNQMAHFNRERVPERNVHAKGSGAFGVFETTEDVSAVHQGRAVPAGRDDRDAGPLLHRGRRAGQPRHLARPARLRAEVLHDRGQLRPRRQQHPGVLHPRHDEVPALHPQPEAAARLRPARQPHAVGLLDLNPESAHQVTYLMGDRGIPRTWRHMNGYGSHTYMWVNAAGEKFWVKYHFHTDQGVEGLTDDEAAAIAGEDADFHRRDLFEAIDARRLPELDAVGAGDAVRGREDLPVQPVRPDQGVAAQRLPADQGRHDDAEPQPGELLRPDRAGRVRARQHGAGHRLLARQDAARPGVRLLRHAPLPDRPELPPAAGQPARRSTVNTYTLDGPMAYEHRGDAPVYAPNTVGRGYADEIGEVDGRLGGRRRRWCGRPTRCAPTTTTSARPAPWSARSGTTSSATRFVDTVAGHLLGGVRGRRARARLRVLEERRPRHRQADREKVRTGTARNAVEGMGESGDRKVQRAS